MTHVIYLFLFSCYCSYSAITLQSSKATHLYPLFLQEKKLFPQDCISLFEIFMYLCHCKFWSKTLKNPLSPHFSCFSLGFATVIIKLFLPRATTFSNLVKKLLFIPPVLVFFFHFKSPWKTSQRKYRYWYWKFKHYLYESINLRTISH